MPGTLRKMGGMQSAQTEVAQIENMNTSRKSEEELMAHPSLKLHKCDYSCFFLFFFIGEA